MQYILWETKNESTHLSDTKSKHVLDLEKMQWLMMQFYLLQWLFFVVGSMYSFFCFRLNEPVMHLN